MESSSTGPCENVTEIEVRSTNQMASVLTIGVVTGSRADFGLLVGVMRGIASSPVLSLRLFVTGMHLSPEFGDTWREIEASGFTIDWRVDMLVSGDSSTSVTKSLGLGVIGFAEAFAKVRPDLVLVLGDRYEILSAVQACLIARIPVAHIAGGDTTEGAVDESIRHAITKMSHLHFVTNSDAANRVRQMGENPEHIFDVGSPGLDSIVGRPVLDREELAEVLGITLRARLLAVTFHPATLSSVSQTLEMQELLTALDRFDAESTVIVFTMPNADVGGRDLMFMVSKYVETRVHTRAFKSLGRSKYLSLIAHADAVVGNSSSGLYEAPTFKTPTVNIGSRQNGRPQAASVINCPAEANAIERAIRSAFVLDTTQVRNPYGDGSACSRILAVLEALQSPEILIHKTFYSAT